MTVFACIVKRSKVCFSSENRSMIKRTFEMSCKQHATFEKFTPNSLLLSYHIENTLTNNVCENKSAISIIAGDPIIRDKVGDLSQEIIDINFAMGSENLAVLLAKAKGVFSGVKLDHETGSVYVFTDKLGIRPVYYYYNDDYLIISSLLTFLENLPLVELSISFKGVCEKLAFGFNLANRTSYEKIKRLNGGECLSLNEKGLNIQLYWDWQNILTKSALSYNDVEAAYQSFDNAVKLRLNQSDEAIAFLSGGLDSRVICAQVNKHVSKLHTFNFSTQRSQDNEFAKLFAHKANLFHHEKQFSSLAFPNWSQLIANEIKDCDQEFNYHTNSSHVWSGDGGSVALGNVYIDNNINKALNNGDNKAAINHYLTSAKISLPIRYLKSTYASQAEGLLEKVIDREFLANEEDPAKAMYYFLMNNDQQRHLQTHFETICEHQIELFLPFFDSSFLECIYALPTSELLYHKFYMRWFKHFPASAQSIPWQTYPQHEKCPIKSPAGLSYQWDNIEKKVDQKGDDFLVYLDVKKHMLFREYFDSKKVFIAMLLHRLGLKDFTYLINCFREISQLK